ncbi:autotransporter domain-containing protein [Phascolarctobacterium sp.]
MCKNLQQRIIVGLVTGSILYSAGLLDFSTCLADGVNIQIFNNYLDDGSGAYIKPGTDVGQQMYGDSICNNVIQVKNSELGSVLGAGGDPKIGDVDGNKVIITGSTITRDVTGAMSRKSSPSANNNTVSINDSVVSGNISGSYLMSYGGNLKAEGNQIKLSGKTRVEGDIYLVKADKQLPNSDRVVLTAKNNTLTISGDVDISKSNIYGCKVDYPTAGDAVMNNNLVIDGWSGKVQSINNFNGIRLNDLKLSNAKQGAGFSYILYTEKQSDLTGSDISIDSITAGDLDVSTGKLYLVGGAITGMEVSDAVKNKLATWVDKEVSAVANDSIGNNVARVHIFGSNTVNENELSMNVAKSILAGKYTDNSGNTTGDGVLVIGNGWTTNATILAGASGDGDSAVENGTLIVDGNHAGNLYGGFSNGSGIVSGNNVDISGGTISGMVYGGWSDGAGKVAGNSITISGNPAFGKDTVLYGGYSGKGDVSGNILNIKAQGVQVANVEKFASYNFSLPGEGPSNVAFLTLTDNSSTDLSGSKVAMQGWLDGAANISNNDTMVLLANTNGTITTDVKTELQSGEIMQGVSVVYDYTTKMSDDNKQVLAEFTNGRANAESKSPVETQLAATAFINSGADLLAGSVISGAATAAGGGNAEMFGAMSGGSMRYKSGSHADVHGYNMALGVGKAIINKAGQLTFGPFVEYGYGNYTSHLDSGVRGDGNTKYYGIGMLARQDNTSGVYYEGSLRYGRMDADYSSNDMSGSLGKVYTQYDSSSAYYGAHLGIGKVTELDDSAKADIYAKLLYTHQRGDSVTLQGQGAGEEYDFDAVDSTRARVGARVSKAYGSRSSGYVGVAYEYEFDGEARATVKGFSTPSPSIKGSSGMLELGYILQPKAANDPAINIGLQGWGGKKQGFTGNVNFVWTF